MKSVDVVVCGAGIAGLAAARALGDLDVVVLEADSRVGGRLRSERRDGVWLNFGGHVFAGAGSASDRLIRAAGVEAPAVPGRLAAVELGGRVFARGRVETFPLRMPLKLASRVAEPLSRDEILEAHARHESYQQKITPAMPYGSLPMLKRHTCSPVLGQLSTRHAGSRCVC